MHRPHVLRLALTLADTNGLTIASSSTGQEYRRLAVAGIRAARSLRRPQADHNQVLFRKALASLVMALEPTTGRINPLAARYAQTNGG